MKHVGQTEEKVCVCVCVWAGGGWSKRNHQKNPLIFPINSYRVYSSFKLIISLIELVIYTIIITLLEWENVAADTTDIDDNVVDETPGNDVAVRIIESESSVEKYLLTAQGYQGMSDMMMDDGDDILLKMNYKNNQNTSMQLHGVRRRNNRSHYYYYYIFLL